jgi:HAMP domain-containing protein/signal transduction histidine kinase/DNA-binding response OmpR family regulator
MATRAAPVPDLDTDALLSVLAAFKAGDFSARLPEHWTGVAGKIADSLNEIIARNQRFSNELARLRQVVGKEGRINQRIASSGSDGGWADSIHSVNDLVGDLVRPTSETARVITAVANGDLTQTVPLEVDGVALQGQFARTAKTVNTMVSQLSSFASEVTRVAREVGTEGELGGQARVKGVGGVWKDLTDSVNTMAGNLTAQVRNIAEVTTAVANGDLSKKITVEGRGEILELKNTINVMVDQLNAFASEVTRVAREVGTEGKLGGQATVRGVGGVWQELTDNVNLLAGQLTSQIRNIAEVTTAVANGDLSKKVTVDVQGEILELKNTINVMVDQLSSFASEVTRVAREVGMEGKLGGQAHVRGVSGTWADLTDNVNTMAANLTGQVRNIAEVTTAVANGDLSKKITVEGRGEILELKDTINVMVDQLNAFASEVTRVAREVGTEGKLGGQAEVRDVGGVWKDLTDNVNLLAGQLTSQIRNIAEVTTAVANGDLSKKVTVRVQGEILELKDTINVMVDQLNAFASEVTRVAREVGTEGKLGGQAQVQGVSGTWKDLTDSVNIMGSNLTGQVRNIAEVTTAVARGDLSKKITVEGRGEILELKDTINVMVDQLNAFASEVTRVAREVGTEGKLGGQADVRDVSGTWKDLTDGVNIMGSNLTSQVRNIAEVTTAVARGDLSKKITVEGRGEIQELKDTINVMVDQLNAFASEVTRVAREVGTEGKLGGQAHVRGVDGVWKELTDNVNLLAGQLTSQIRNIAEVTTAVARGDLSRKVTVDVQGEILELKSTINVMVDQLNAFASEVTRVGREVGTEGKLGGQAYVPGVSGVWKDLTDNVNLMADNLTAQVRGIARVVTAVANGDLRRKLALEAKGEVAALAETINEMTDTLATFADQVTTVARQVGVEGRLGGQASVPGAAGTWKDLTDNVNQLAATLTDQIRAIADVATSVTEGDLTRSIGIQASGEIVVLKDNINAMIRNLRETTQRNTEQDWLKTNLAHFTRLLQGQRDLMAASRLILSELAPLVNAQHGVFYTMDVSQPDEPVLRYQAGYAYRERKHLATLFRVGEGLVGQCALERERISLHNVPGDYIAISSGLGETPPLSIVVLPIVFEGQVLAVIELASVERFSHIHLDFLDQLTESIAIVLNTIEATTRTEMLLQQSQSMAGELQTQQEELRHTNEELEEKARLLADRNTEVERKNDEVEQARRSLEEKAEQLALTSKYKSEFLANMSHELRTPLNSLLILAQQLAENGDGNLSNKQVEFANIILASGQDLLNLINDILDLSKIESGTVALEISEETFGGLREQIERSFRHVADARGLTFTTHLEPGLPRRIRTDSKRLQQVLKNLLSNAFKFTERGRVELRIRVAEAGWDTDVPTLEEAEQVIALDVADTGIGIAPDKQRHIFEAFQQSDGTTSRKYGGTGLGLSISRELVRLLGGQIKLRSMLGVGSTFTVFLPVDQPAIREAGDRPEHPTASPAPAVEDDRAQLLPGQPLVLIVDDDVNFCRVLLDLAHQSSFQGIVALGGEEALTLARRYRPTAVTLDIGLRDISGWKVLDALRQDPETSDIPVHVVTVFEDAQERVARHGKASFLAKPATKNELEELFGRIQSLVSAGARHLLIVEDDQVQRTEIVRSIEGNVVIHEAGTVADAIALAHAEQVDCVVLDLRLPDVSGFKLLEHFRKSSRLRRIPIVIYTAAELNAKEAEVLRRAGCQVVVKGGTGSSRSLVDQVGRFLERVSRETAAAELPARAAANGRDRNGAAFTAVPAASEPVLPAARGTLSGHSVLVVDDDVRNVFALTALLERHGMRVVPAESGQEAIRVLESAGEQVDVVLLDMMMPEVDGYETLRRIRGRNELDRLPIIALTAKAMKGDRERCLEAGATDYIAKPIDSSQLIAMLDRWLNGS